MTHIVSFSCSRCGEMLRGGNECADQDDPYSEGGYSFGCMERQLSNMRSLLRSVTGKLEEAAELLNSEGVQDSSCVDAKVASCLVDDVLRALS